MEFTEEQMKQLVEGFRQHDFTQSVSLSGVNTVPDDQAEAFVFFQNLVSGYMESNLPGFGVNRNMQNFSKNHPVNLLLNADSTYIAKEAAEILDDEERGQAGVEQFFDMFGPLVETATNSFCRSKGKTKDELTGDDIMRILNRVTTVVNEELSSALMAGQQFATLNEVSHDLPTHEDHKSGRNPDAISFYNKWNHCKTAVGEMLSLDDVDVDEPARETDMVFDIMCKAFCETLDDTDATIFRMREDGFTQAEIAKKLGYKTHSAVNKRLQAMRKRWDAFMSDREPRRS